MAGIKADAQTYEVKLTTEPIGGGGDGRTFLGSSDESTNVIVIDGTMPPARQEEVLLHELCHIADPTAPEFAIKAMSNGLYGVLRSNGLLVSDLIGKVKTGEVTPAEMAELNQHAEALAEKAAQMGFMRKGASSEVGSPSDPLPGREAYDVSEWKAACLLPEFDVLPIRSPRGVPSLPAMQLAAAQLLGVRPGPNLTADQKREAVRKLVWAYRGMKVEPPASLALL